MCIKTGHKCEFPDPPSRPPKRSQPPTAPEQVRVGHPNKRVKKLEETTTSEESNLAERTQALLSASYLTVDVWLQLFNIYKLHFATEIPFLHLPTLKGIIHDKDIKKPSAESNLTLLGILTLTAKFHPGLVDFVAHITQDKIASPESRALTAATVARVQAYLMLGLHKWSQPKGGLAAWMYVGVAIRMAQALRLGFGDQPLARKQILAPSPRSSPSAQPPSDQEVRRRTMFSCLILDRLLSCGSDRVSMVQSEDLEIQLPCTQYAFDLGRIVYTEFLRQVRQDVGRPIDDSLLSQFVQLADVWGDITKYSVEGGRLTELLPPWDQESTFYGLRKKIEAFYAHLPESFTWSKSNLWKNGSSGYVPLHMLVALCKIILHRENIPFIAIDCSEPIGPLDELSFDPGTVPDDFWKRSAEQVFKAGTASEIIDLVSFCRNEIPHSSLVIFAIWQAALVGTYAWHYPHMDTQNHMVGKDIEERNSGAKSEGAQVGNVSIALQALNKVAPYLRRASKYVNPEQ
ncbi:fungal specific transcription factor [Colletotrichum abscissum]|uniref:fungal specific transcription factor n=1 Tax=Colletotrichum abscissum TaxID=1671311 RepID=UPI0027D4B079|nr:fungal specific transcription factor [Colletotrichum abscissum]KAK1471187.1 fungal specific transcription factor [Colletotrichum abscissum]